MRALGPPRFRNQPPAGCPDASSLVGTAGHTARFGPSSPPRLPRLSALADQPDSRREPHPPAGASTRSNDRDDRASPGPSERGRPGPGLQARAPGRGAGPGRWTSVALAPSHFPRSALQIGAICKALSTKHQFSAIQVAGSSTLQSPTLQSAGREGQVHERASPPFPAGPDVERPRERKAPGGAMSGHCQGAAGWRW